MIDWQYLFNVPITWRQSQSSSSSAILVVAASSVTYCSPMLCSKWSFRWTRFQKKKLRTYARMTALAFQILCFNQKYLAFLVFFHQYWRLVTCAPKEIRTNKKQKHQLNSYGLIWLYKNRIPIARHTNRGRIMNLGRRKKVIKHFFEVASRLVQV